MAASIESRIHRRPSITRSVGLSLLIAVVVVAQVDRGAIEHDAAEASSVTVRQTSLDLSRLSPQQFADWDNTTTR